MSAYRLLPVVVAVIATLAACAPAPEPVPTEAAHSPTPSPTPSYVQPATPVSRLGIGCGDLGALAGFGALESGSATDPMIVAGTFGGTSSSVGSLERLPIVQAGGIDCGWQDPATGTAATAILLPDGASAYTQQSFPAEQAETPGWGDAAHVGCRSREGSGCLFDVVVGTTWIQLTTYSTRLSPVQLEAPSEAWALEVVAAVADAGEPSPLWVAPVSALPASCEGLLPDASWTGLGSLTASDELVGAIPPIALAAGEQVGALACAWKGSKAGYVTLTAVPGAAWAWAEHPPESNVSLTLTDIPGVGDGAMGGCTTQFVASCVVHVITAGGWIAVGMEAPEGTALPAVEDVAAALVDRSLG